VPIQHGRLRLIDYEDPEFFQQLYADHGPYPYGTSRGQ
jgi:hypothetical protein